MARPSERQTADMTARLCKTRYGPLGARVQDALKRDASGSPTPDGYPRSTMGGNGGGVGDPTGSTVAAREQEHRDRYHELTTSAVKALFDMVSALDRLEGSLHRLDALELSAPTLEGRCRFCQLADISAPGEHYGDCGGRLPMPADLCDSHYDFVQRHHHAPIKEQTLNWFHHPGTGWKPHWCPPDCELKKARVR